MSVTGTGTPLPTIGSPMSTPMIEDPVMSEYCALPHSGMVQSPWVPLSEPSS